jgi:hypothetical protein
MRTTVTLLTLLLITAVLCHAQLRRTPRFEDYPARLRFPARSAQVNIRSTPYTPCFRTMLRLAARSGDRFAGHYRVITFGCGTECIRIGITDLISGRTYISPFAIAGAGIEVRPGSRLLIADSARVLRETYGDDPPLYRITKYYVWNGRNLVELENGRLTREPAREFLRCSERR